jgi:predicted nucleotidyltransferase
LGVGENLFVEGFYVESHGVIYSVKGICDYNPLILIVKPKYAKTGCTKIGSKDVNCNLEYIESIGVKSCVIRKDDVSLVYNPFEYSKARLPYRVRKFVEYIEQIISNGEVGLTGSYLLGCPSKDSDIDLVIRGYSLGHDYSKLVSMLKYRNECNDEFVIKNYKEKILPDKSMSLQDYLFIYKIKTLEGCFDGIPYSIRLIENEISLEICNLKFVPIGEETIVGYLRQVKPYTTPSIYQLTDKYTGRLYNLMSWRIRYSELPDGQYTIKGDLFIDSKGRLWIIPDHTGWIRLLRQ